MFADVTSANIVGYKADKTGRNKQTAQISSFISVDGTLADRTLNDIVPASVAKNEFTAENFNIIPYDDKGNPLCLGDSDWLWDDEELNRIEGWADFMDTYAEKDANFAYLDGKWYIAQDTAKKYEVGRFPIAVGQGYIVKAGIAHSSGVTTTTSGSVPQADFEKTIGRNKQELTGNMSAVDRTLADFTPVSVAGNEFTAENFNIIPYDEKGNPLALGDCDWLWDDEELNTIEGWADFMDTYAEKDVNFAYLDNKWYIAQDTAKKYEVSRFPITAGQAFVAKAGIAHSSGVKLTLPHAFK